MKLLKKGAEACLYRDVYLGLPAIRKERVRKPYRHPELDREIRESRTVLEGRLLSDAKRAGVPTPAVFQVDTAASTLLMEYIDGAILRDSVDTMNKEEYREVFEKLGEYVARLHDAGIVHGDLTTTNVIIDPASSLHLVDFGLGEYSMEIEHRGVDLHLLLRTLESSHSRVIDACWRPFADRYRNEFSGDADSILSKVREIRRRGRYVEERKQT